MSRRENMITSTDQHGSTFAYPMSAAFPTAVPDALSSHLRRSRARCSGAILTGDEGSMNEQRPLRAAGQPAWQWDRPSTPRTA